MSWSQGCTLILITSSHENQTGPSPVQSPQPSRTYPRTPSRAKSSRVPRWAKLNLETNWDELIELSFKPNNEPRANPEPRAKPESGQVNQRAEPSFEPSWNSNRSEPVPQPEPGLERVQYCAIGSVKLAESRAEPSPGWVGIEPISELGRVWTKPSGILSPEPSLETSSEPNLEHSPEPRSSRAPNSSRKVFELSRAELRVEHRADLRAYMHIRASNKAEPSIEPRVLVWAGPIRYLSLAEPILELRRAKHLAKTSSASSRVDPNPDNRTEPSRIGLPAESSQIPIQAEPSSEPSWSVLIVNTRTGGGLSHLRTSGGGGGWPPPPRELEN